MYIYIYIYVFNYLRFLLYNNICFIIYLLYSICFLLGSSWCIQDKGRMSSEIDSSRMRSSLGGAGDPRLGFRRHGWHLGMRNSSAFHSFDLLYRSHE